MEGLLILGAIVIGVMWLAGAFKDKKSNKSNPLHNIHDSSTNSSDQWNYSHGCHHEWKYSHKGIEKHWYTCKKCGRRGTIEDKGPNRVW